MVKSSAKGQKARPDPGASRTGDLGGKATTAEFTLALVSRIANG